MDDNGCINPTMNAAYVICTIYPKPIVGGNLDSRRHSGANTAAWLPVIGNLSSGPLERLRLPTCPVAEAAPKTRDQAVQTMASLPCTPAALQ